MVIQKLQTDSSQPIRVGFVMHLMQVAGAEVLVTQIIKQLGHQIEPTVFCLDALGELGEKLLAAGIPVVVLDRKPGLDIGTARRLAGEVKARGIQVLHAHQYTPFFYSAICRILHRAKTRILFTEHGRHYPDVVPVKRRLINRFILQRYAEVTTACCDFSTMALKQNDGFPRAYTLPNGVDLELLQPRIQADESSTARTSLGMDLMTPYAACIARFHAVKDHETLIRAWEIVHHSIPNAKLLLIGDGDRRERYEKLVTDLELNDSVEFWGIRNDIPQILKAVNVFTLTSVSEAASLTLLEAMACGCPSVLTDVGGNSEHVTHGVEGYLAGRGNAKDIATHLIQLLSSPEITNQMGQAARERVERDFDLTKVIELYHDIYSNLANN